MSPRRRLAIPVAALFGLVALAGFGAQAAIEPSAESVVPTIEDPLAAPMLDAAPAPGVTGSVALPTLAPAEASLPIDPGATIPAAAPFRLRGSFVDRSRALQCLTTAIYYEAATEPDDGQRAVAQVVLNRVRHSAFPATVCGVVFQGSDRKGCQFSFACDGAMARRPMASAWTRAQRVAAEALNGAVFGPVGLATHYHTYAVTPAWNRSLVMTGVHGAHFFHRWKGWWGTPAAFRDRYAGGEPVPGPLAPAVPLPPMETAAPALPEPPQLATVQPAALPPPIAPQVQPRYAESGSVLDAAAPEPSADSQILDKWKDAGKPIR